MSHYRLAAALSGFHPGCGTGVACLALLGAIVAGCAPLATSGLGIGMSTGVSHTLEGTAYKTFTAPLSRIRESALDALDRMGITVTSTSKTGNGELILSKSGDRSIEVELEAVSSRATRVRSVVKRGAFYYDSATASEIISQTQNSLDDLESQARDRTKTAKPEPPPVDKPPASR